MAEANSLEDEKVHHLQGLRAIMPHLEHPDRRVMDELYPPLTAAEDVDDQGRSTWIRRMWFTSRA